MKSESVLFLSVAFTITLAALRIVSAVSTGHDDQVLSQAFTAVGGITVALMGAYMVANKNGKP